MNLKKFQRDYYRNLAASDSKQLPKANLRFEPPKSVTATTWHQPHYGLLFCVHGRSYFEPCHATTCRRSKREADSKLREFTSKL